MNPTDMITQFALLAEATTPTIVEEIGNTMYIGYARPDTKGEDDPTWLIKRVQKTMYEDEGYVQTILFAEGVRRYNQRWSERNNLTYRISPAEIDTEKED